MNGYESRGVSAQKQDVEAATAGLDKGLYPGAFCRIVPDFLGGSAAHCTLLHADGAGTKASLAYLHYARHGDPAIFRGIAVDSLVMNLDDMLCVGATGPFVLSNTIGRNAKLVPQEVLREVVEGYDETCRMLAGHGIEVHPCGGETADVGDLVRTIIVDSTMAARMRRDQVIDAARVRPGHVIVGLASFGRATYESAYNSGIGSNGMTLARHELLGGDYRERHPETFAPEIEGLAYTGSCDIDDPLPGTDMTVGEALLSPTRTFAPVMVRILAAAEGRISAIFHNSGGGQTKCLKFGRGVTYVKDDLFPLPPLFRLIRDRSGLPMRELAQVFNLGHRMEVVCERAFADEAIAIAGALGVEARVVGRVEPGSEKPSLRLRVEGEDLAFGG